MIGSSYDTVIKNIKAAAFECSRNKTIKKVTLNAVISSINYKEIPKLAEFAAKLDIYLELIQFHPAPDISFGSDYASVSVWDKNHPEFEEFKKILKHPALNYEKIYMPPSFAEIYADKN